MALEHLYPEGLSYASDCGSVDAFGGIESLCPSCGCYSHTIAFLTRYVDDTVNIYYRPVLKVAGELAGAQRLWRYLLRGKACTRLSVEMTTATPVESHAGGVTPSEPPRKVKDAGANQEALARTYPKRRVLLELTLAYNLSC